MSMTKQAKRDVPEPEARRLRRELFTDEMLDQLMAATDERGLSLTGEGGEAPPESWRASLCGLGLEDAGGFVVDG